MDELNDIAQENNVNLDNCIIFVKGDDDILAVDVNNVRIKQRSDDTMAFRFSISPKQTLKLEEFFNKFETGEKFYFDITQTGYRPVYYRGLSPVNKEVNTQEDSLFNINLFAQKAIVEPDDSYFAPTCACCEFCHIG